MQRRCTKSLSCLIFDGAFGTYYFEKTGDERPCEEANLTAPQTVKQIHREYIKAGCDAIKTNTFSCAASAAGERLHRLISAGYRLANEAAQESGCQVYCDIGGIEDDDAAQKYLDAAGIFISLGGKNFLFETLSEFEPLLPAIELIRSSISDSKIIISFAVSQEGYTRKGKYYRRLLEAAANVTDICGLNCMCGPAHMLELIRSLGSGLRLIAMPNSGYPASINGRMEYRSSPEYFASKLQQISQLGVVAVGGCCGTTPRHIKLAAEAVRTASERCADRSDVSIEHISASPRHSVSREKQPDRKLIAVELDPPADTDFSHMIQGACAMRDAGADLITVTDSPLARTRADSFLISAKLRREADIEVMPHLSCRDRNHIALKGALIAGSIEGISKVLAVTGDAIAHSSQGERGVFACNSFQLISMISELNADLLQGHEYTIACALNVNAPNFDAELKRASKKRECGASVFYTQPVFSDEAISNVSRAREALGSAVCVGIMPPAGYKNAVFLANEVPGVDIPQEVIDALKDKPQEQAFEISCNFAMSVIERVFDSAYGFYLMTPLRKWQLTSKLTALIRQQEQKSREKQK